MIALVNEMNDLLKEYVQTSLILEGQRPMTWRFLAFLEGDTPTTMRFKALLKKFPSNK